MKNITKKTMRATASVVNVTGCVLTLGGIWLTDSVAARLRKRVDEAERLAAMSPEERVTEAYKNKLDRLTKRAEKKGKKHTKAQEALQAELTTEAEIYRVKMEQIAAMQSVVQRAPTVVVPATATGTPIPVSPVQAAVAPAPAVTPTAPAPAAPVAEAPAQ